MELITHCEILAKDIAQLAVDVQRARPTTLSDDGNHIIFNVDILQVDTMNFPDPQAELIHQSIDGVVANAQDGVVVDLI